MNTLISMIIKKKSNPVKGLTCKAKHLKTQTNLELSFEKKDRPNLDFYNTLTEDIAALGIGDGTIGVVTFLVGDAPAIGRMHNRAIRALSRLDVHCNEIEWDTESGMLEFTIADGVADDLPAFVDLIARLIFRSCMKCAHTRHSLTLFDLKQTTGLIQDHRDEIEGIEDMLGWFNVRELVVNEREKAAAKVISDKKRKAKAAAKKAESTDKAKPVAKKVDKPEEESGAGDPNE